MVAVIVFCDGIYDYPLHLLFQNRKGLRKRIGTDD